MSECTCAERGVTEYNGSVFVRQLGSSLECARKGCTRGLRWRVIHGAWNLQTYVCSTHLRWALELEQLSDNAGTRLGWEPGYPTLSRCGHYVVSYTCREGATVTPTMQQITPYGHGKRGGRNLDYGRDVSGEISGMWPIRDATGFPVAWGNEEPDNGKGIA